MVLWWLLAVALLLFALQYRESFTDPERAISRPELTPEGNIPSIWQSKIDANSPISSNDIDYFNALQAFYDKVYAPSPVRPKDTDVEAFLKTPDATFPNADTGALRKMIGSVFTIESTISAAAREQKEMVTTGALAGFSGSSLQPGDARDEVRTREEGLYVPADSRNGEFPEGLYLPTEQTFPTRPGDLKDNAGSWSSTRPYSVCPCAENVL